MTHTVTYVPPTPAARVPADLSLLAAELTAAAYPVALRHGAGAWLELELEIWQAMSHAVEQWHSRKDRLHEEREVRHASRHVS
jgi:hypothetical protein